MQGSFFERSLGGRAPNNARRHPQASLCELQILFPDPVPDNYLRATGFCVWKAGPAKVGKRIKKPFGMQLRTAQKVLTAPGLPSPATV